MRIVLEVAVTLMFIAIGVVMLVEFMAGCGETYIDAKGYKHVNECIIITPTP